MSAIGLVLRAMGHHVSGSDLKDSPVVERLRSLGVDVVVHSATKAIAGHSDVLLGVVISRRPEVVELLHNQRTVHGAIPGPFEAWLGLRGLRTLALRVRRAQDTAGELARRLQDHPRVTKVRYPGLPDDPGHARALAQMDGPGTMVSFEVDGDAEAAERMHTAYIRRARWLRDGGFLRVIGESSVDNFNE